MIPRNATGGNALKFYASVRLDIRKGAAIKDGDNILGNEVRVKVVKNKVFLADMGDFGAMNEVYSEYFKAPFPARCAFAVKALPKDAMVEIECVAAL